MSKSIVWLVVVVLICVALWYGLTQWKTNRYDTDGSVRCVQNCDTPDQKAAFAKINSGDTADGQREHKDRTAREDAAAVAAGFPSSDSGQAGQGYGDNQVVPNVVPPGQTASDDRYSVSGAKSPITSAPVFVQPQAAPAGLPMGDSRLPDAPNNLRFAGSGSYQWYRQGNLTWRVDTTTGQSCVIYATMEEWRNPVVRRHGCVRTR